jgi:hypothetical protein
MEAEKGTALIGGTVVCRPMLPLCNLPILWQAAEEFAQEVFGLKKRNQIDVLTFFMDQGVAILAHRMNVVAVIVWYTSPRATLLMSWKVLISVARPKP